MESQVDRLKLINQVSVIGCLFDVDVQDVFAGADPGFDEGGFG